MHKETNSSESWGSIQQAFRAAGLTLVMTCFANNAVWWCKTSALSLHCLEIPSEVGMDRMRAALSLYKSSHYRYTQLQKKIRSRYRDVEPKAVSKPFLELFQIQSWRSLFRILFPFFRLIFLPLEGAAGIKLSQTSKSLRNCIFPLQGEINVLPPPDPLKKA